MGADRPTAVHTAEEKQHSASLVAIVPGNSSYASMTARHYFCLTLLLDIGRPGLGGSATVDDYPALGHTRKHTRIHIIAKPDGQNINNGMGFC